MCQNNQILHIPGFDGCATFQPKYQIKQPISNWTANLRTLHLFRSFITKNSNHFKFQILDNFYLLNPSLPLQPYNITYRNDRHVVYVFNVKEMWHLHNHLFHFSVWYVAVKPRHVRPEFSLLIFRCVVVGFLFFLG